MDLIDNTSTQDTRREELLRECARCLGSGSHLSARHELALRRWWDAEQVRSATLAEALGASAAWTHTIVEHRAHRHPFYDELAESADTPEFAEFLLENWAFPAFLPLVRRALEVQMCPEARAALLRNIHDEQIPTPHATLMRRLMTALKARVGDSVQPELGESLIDRTLIFYYGYFCDPWNLVGALYATEVMGRHRMVKMGAGLERLGFGAADLEFIRVHIVCDDDHANDWMRGVVVPSLAVNPMLRARLAQGIAACLSTSARYLDDLMRRAERRRGQPR
ncbi:MAG TPA: iron-containing redox enzyme family protein [Burkholderiaceae bacterium]|nr:iron-containing redox enzyme family protein [Burkholderiaceae bacterium]